MEISKGIHQLAKELGGEQPPLPKVEIKKGSLQAVPPFLLENNYEKVLLIVDENTYKAAGKQLKENISHSGCEVMLVSLKGNRHDQVIADEQTVVELLVEIPANTDMLIAVGTGTIHDITRFCGYKMNIPFISIPTAASVDGFTSKGAPLILKSVKQTIQTASPVAVFADIDVLKKAPRAMTAAGFGDILAKYTSLLDWKISYLVGKEPYNQLAAEMTRSSLEVCVKYVDEIAEADDEGLKILMHALIESGLVMLLLDFSRPASGGEHHLSHYWEMDVLHRDAKQLLHGAKVGVATIIVADLYRLMDKSFDPNELEAKTDDEKQLLIHWSTIKNEIEGLPDSDRLRALLKRVGGPATSDDLGISNALVEESLNEAYHLRDRCTGLRLINQIWKKRITYPWSELEF